MSRQPINPLWSIRDTAGRKSLSRSLRTPRQAIQYKDMFEARRLSVRRRPPPPHATVLCDQVLPSLAAEACTLAWGVGQQLGDSRVSIPQRYNRDVV